VTAGVGIVAGWRPRDTERWWPSILLAVVAHVGLVLALALAVNWKGQTDVVTEAEVWSEIPRAAGPAVAPPPPLETAPEPQPVRPAEPTAEPTAEVKPDIVTATTPPKPEKKRKAAKEPREVFETAPPKGKVDAKTPPTAKPKPKPKPDTTAKSEAASASERETLRQANLARMMSDLGGGPGGAGRAAASSGPSKSYIGRLIARIKPNIVFTDPINGNPLAQVEVRCAPDGRIVSRKLVVPSGAPAWDTAVLRALDRTEVLPLNEQGRIEAVMLLDFRPQDF
jgi:colicin import membrane protein